MFIKYSHVAVRRKPVYRPLLSTKRARERLWVGCIILGRSTVGYYSISRSRVTYGHHALKQYGVREILPSVMISSLRVTHAALRNHEFEWNTEKITLSRGTNTFLLGNLNLRYAIIINFTLMWRKLSFLIGHFEFEV
jgi:hypothetical protein